MGRLEATLFTLTLGLCACDGATPEAEASEVSVAPRGGAATTASVAAASTALTSSASELSIPTEASTRNQTEPRKAELVAAESSAPGRVGYQVAVGQTRFLIWGAERAGMMPKGLATSSDGKWLFSANMGVENVRTLSVYSTDGLRLEKELDLSGKAIEAIAPSGELFITNSKNWGTLQVLSIGDLVLQREVAVPGFPKWLEFDAERNTLYASLWALDGISRIALPDGKVETLRTPKGRYSRHTSRDKNPRGMALTPDGKTLYVANNADETLSLIDTASFTERKRVRVGYAPRHVVISQSGRLYVSLTGNDSVLEFDTSSETALGEIAVGARPKTIAVSHDDRFLYVGNFAGNSLSIIDLRTRESTELQLDLHKVSGLAVRPDDRFIYVTGFCTHDVWAVERLDKDRTPTGPLGSDRDNDPCLDCPSSFVGCPYYDGPKSITVPTSSKD